MTHSTAPDPSIIKSCFFARHPIFQRDMKLWGYQLHHRDTEKTEPGHVLVSDQATVQVALEAATNSRLDLTGHSNLLVDFSPEALIHEFPFLLPTRNTVVSLTPDLCRNDFLTVPLANLHAEGYRLALHGPVEARRFVMFSPDYLIVDALQGNQETFTREMKAANRTGIPILVKGVQDQATFELARKMGGGLFLGFFFQKPEIIATRQLSSMQVVRLKLLRMLESQGDDWVEIAKILQNDASLTYRLLKFINSPFFSVMQPITTVQRAIGYLGGKQARVWLRMVIFTDLVPPEKTSQLTLLSAQRARFLELVGSSRPGVDPDELFLLGLFSMLDAIFDMPMPDLVDYLPLTEDLKATLCSRPSTSGPWLELATRFEHAHWEAVDSLLQQLELEPVQVAAAYVQAMTWIEDFFQVAG